LDAWLSFAALLFTFLVVASPYAVFVFVNMGQPYGLSGLLMGGGLIALLRPAGLDKITVTIAAIAMALGGGLNPSLVLVATVVCAVAFICWPAVRRQAMVACVLSVGSCGLWLLIGTQFPGPHLLGAYGKFPVTGLWANLASCWRSLSLGFTWAPLIAGAGIAAAAALIMTVRPLGGRRPRWLLLGLSSAFALGWLGLFAQNEWVMSNDWNLRYFYPITFAAMLVLAAPPVALLMKYGDAVRAAVMGLLLAACPVLLAAPWQRLDDFPVFAHVAGFVADAGRLDVRLVAGSYWSVWPTVFMLERQGPAFGIDGARGMGNRFALVRAMERMELDGKRPRSLCVDADVDRCLRQLEQITSWPWRLAAGTCGANCTLIEVADGPRAARVTVSESGIHGMLKSWIQRLY
jgi:hypothetical protein